MTTPDAPVRRMQECFNTRQFDHADDLFTPDFFSHPLGTTGFEASRDVWRTVVAHCPDYRIVAQDILVDHDKVAVRSSVEGIRRRPATSSRSSQGLPSGPRAPTRWQADRVTWLPARAPNDALGA